MDPARDPPATPPPAHDGDAPKRESVRARARRAQIAKEAALGPVGRIELALTLGLRAQSLRRLGDP